MLRTMGRRWWGPIFALMLASCASVLTPASTLVGTWDLHLAQGRTVPVVIENFGHGMYYLIGHTPMDGVYRKQGDELVCQKPNDPRLQGFIWRIQNHNMLTLISQPRLWVVQERYLGDRLTRDGAPAP